MLQKKIPSEDDVYTPALWYFDLLLFTRDSETCSTSISNLDDEGNSDNFQDLPDKETETQKEAGEEHSDIEEEEQIKEMQAVSKVILYLALFLNTYIFRLFLFLTYHLENLPFLHH